MSDLNKLLCLWINMMLIFQNLHSAHTAEHELPGWNNEILNADQLEEIAVEEKGLFYNNVVIVMYGRKCQSKLRLHNINKKDLPPENFLLFCKYNYDKARKETWLEMDDSLDLKLRYGTNDCLDVVLFKRGMGKDSEPHRWTPDSDETFLEWVWKKLRIKLSVANKLSSPVAVHFESVSGEGPLLSPAYLPVGTTQVIQTFPAYIALVFATQATGTKIDEPSNTFLDAKILRQDLRILLSVVPKRKKYSARGYIEITKEKQENEIKRYTKWLTSHVHRTLLNTKQSPFIPALNENGYQVVEYSRDLQNKLILYYQQHSERLSHEIICNEQDAALETEKYEWNCDTFRINKKLQMEIVKPLNQMAHDFCNCDVKLVAINNMTVYHPANYIYRHVKKPERAGITVLVQVLKDTSTKEPWVTELTNVEGGKVNLNLGMREILIYESSRLVFGRPNTLKGAAYIELAVEYVPYRSWPFTSEKIASYIAQGIASGTRILKNKKVQPVDSSTEETSKTPEDNKKELVTNDDPKGDTKADLKDDQKEDQKDELEDDQKEDKKDDTTDGQKPADEDTTKVKDAGEALEQTSIPEDVAQDTTAAEPLKDNKRTRIRDEL